jgi:hypothetical protein
VTGRAIARRVDELERALPPPDLSKLTDAELEAAMMDGLIDYRADEMQALADPSSTPARQAQAADALRLLAEALP